MHRRDLNWIRWVFFMVFQGRSYINISFSNSRRGYGAFIEAWELIAVMTQRCEMVIGNLTLVQDANQDFEFYKTNKSEDSILKEAVYITSRLEQPAGTSSEFRFLQTYKAKRSVTAYVVIAMTILSFCNIFLQLPPSTLPLLIY